jgi:predicted amidohydrolase YtcJ
MRSFFLILLALVGAAGCRQRESADLIIRGGTIYTMDEQQPVVEAVAVKGTKILFAGRLSDTETYRGKQTQEIDLAGKTLTPGLIEGHGHILGLGYNEINIDLLNAASYEEVVERVRYAAAKAKPGQWIVGRGWHQDKWDKKPEPMYKGFPTHHALSSVSPDNPVYLRHASGHAGLANAYAMQQAGVNQLSREKAAWLDEEGGEIIRDALGNPTGVFNERAQTLITDIIPEATAETDAQALELAMEACARHGITSFHDAGASRENIELFYRFRREGKLKTRLYVMLTGYDRPMVYEWFRRGPDVDSAHFLTIRSVKIYGDGALGSRGAWLLEPYTDRPGFYGMATYPMDTLLKIARLALKAGFQVCTHGIGDRVNREILDRYAIAFSENLGVTDHRFRIEHAQHLHPADIPRFGQLGVIPAMQAIHLSSDRPWAIDRLGAQRIKEGAYVWQSLLQSGARIVNGTDAPVEPINPIANFYASVTRKTLKGEPAGGFEPEQKMTRAQALRSYTLDAAYGAFEENIKGSIVPGKLADFTVFDQDLMTVDEDKLLGTQIEMTIVGGQVVYQRIRI